MSIRTLLSAAAANYLSTLSKVDIFNDGSCKALYKLDGNALDESGNYNGTPTNVTYGSGRFGSALTGDGTARYISVSSVFGLVNGGEATYSLWIKQSTANLSWAVSNYNSGIVNGIQFAIGAEQKIFFGNYVANANYYIKTSSIVVPLNTWAHVVGVVHANGTTDIYVNGVLDTSAEVAYAGVYAPSQIGTRSYYIGRIYSAGGANLYASIDQIRIFNRAISYAEVIALYNEI